MLAHGARVGSTMLFESLRDDDSTLLVGAVHTPRLITERHLLWMPDLFPVPRQWTPTFTFAGAFNEAT